ncbi:MAG: radical SAM protein, partial [Deltaproteobacteria bacterium]|nr:radical SAM protein [Deltaproteobacteria bacterium]
LAFSPPRANRSGRAALLLGVLDRHMRRVAGRYLHTMLRHPLELRKRLHVQTISAVQPVDVLPTGECDTCDGCPNRTFWNGRLIAACRAEEYRMFGAPVQLVPHGKSKGAPGAN